ncbi:hypothetical protein OH491_01515 [Termitidicoccus mucosus]|uniref:Type IV secretion system protein n=1 Tax=Termitidicoccus mucosus TaxID=1184151 RepID=A0A178IKY0_9BACT|nr:hypothetical protein AW736_08040 [Opitutaceae bacterium TSB47]
MEHFVPGVRGAILGLTDTLRFVVFFVAVIGLVIQVHRARADMESLVRPLVRAVLVVGIIATLPHWFGFTERIFLNLADVVNERYTEHPMQTATLLRDSVAENPDEFSLRRIGESLYRASLWAAAKLIVLIASLLQLPFLLLQYLLKLLCYLFLPIALGLMLVPSLTSLAVRYVQQTIAVLAWPVGFAVTELVAYHLLTAYQQNLAAAYGIGPGEIHAASFASFLGALLAALWLILGTLGTPFLMQALICSGSPLSTGGTSSLQQLYAIQQIAWMIKSVKTGGAALPAIVAKAGSDSGPRGGPTMPPPPPPAPVTPPPPPANSTGDARAHAVLVAAQLPAPHTTI